MSYRPLKDKESLSLMAKQDTSHCPSTEDSLWLLFLVRMKGCTKPPRLSVLAAEFKRGLS